MNIKLSVSVIIACFVVIFIFQNTTIVEISFLHWSLSMSRSLLVLIFVAIGIVIGWLLKGHISFKK